MFLHDIHVIDDIIDLAQVIIELTKMYSVKDISKVNRYVDRIYVLITQFTTGDRVLDKSIYSCVYNKSTCELLPSCKQDKIKSRRTIIADNLSSKIMQLKCIQRAYIKMMESRSKFNKAIAVCIEDESSFCGCKLM